MPSIASIVAEFSGVKDRIERAVRISITRCGNDIASRLRTSSPVRTGELRYGWRLGRAYSANGIVASISITNSVPHAIAIEYGIDPSSSHSWAISLKNPDSRKKKAKPSITLKGGKIWSSSAVGGVSYKAISNGLVRDLTRSVADSVIAAIAKKG